MNRRQQRQRNRADRRMQYAGLRAEFLLAGGHKDWLVPFSHAWLTQMQQQIASIAKGDPYFTKPRYTFHDRTIQYTGTGQAGNYFTR